ncbi:MAG: ATP synthase F1 subunit epsilon [Cyanophyceae cyanobacterium]
MSLNVRIIAPDRTVWDQSADEVILPATSGQLGILSGHAPLLTAIGTGVMRVRSAGEWHAIAVMGGFAEVDQDDVTVLVNRAERGDKIDRSAAEAAQSAADKVLADSTDKQDRLQAKVDRQRATALLQASEMVSKS